MSRYPLTLLAAAALAANAPSASAAEIMRAQDPVAGSYVVVFNTDAARLATETSQDEAEAIPSLTEATADLLAPHGLRPTDVYTHTLRGFAVRTNEATARLLAADNRVAYVAEDGMAYPVGTQSPATWGIDRVDQRYLPLNNTYVYDQTGSGVHAYVIDTGLLATHSQFTGRVGNGYSLVNDGRGTGDCNGHGTHVAGTILGTTYGVAKSAIVHPVRVFGCTGGAAWTTVISAVNWVTANAIRPAVVNMSLSGGAYQPLDDAIVASINSRIVYAVAAGNNNGLNACSYSPARVPAALTVGSTTNTDARSSFSNIGSCLDLFAPGSSITSAWYTSNTATNTISGTSMATPHVAGIAALYLQTNPGATAATVHAAVVNNATSGVVTNAGTGSPNRLAYSRFLPTLSVTLTVSNGVATATASGGAPPYTYRWYVWVDEPCCLTANSSSSDKGEMDLPPCEPYLNESPDALCGFWDGPLTSNPPNQFQCYAGERIQVEVTDSVGNKVTRTTFC